MSASLDLLGPNKSLNRDSARTYQSMVCSAASSAGPLRLNNAM